MNPSLLHDDNAKHNNRQYWPDDHKYPDVDLFVGDTKHPGPINQYIHTPIEDLIHHVFLLWKGFYVDRSDFMANALSESLLDSQVHK